MKLLRVAMQAMRGKNVNSVLFLAREPHTVFFIFRDAGLEAAHRPCGHLAAPQRSATGILCLATTAPSWRLAEIVQRLCQLQVQQVQLTTFWRLKQWEARLQPCA